jgi:hypothetical protein
MCLLPVNTEEVLVALDRRMAGYGNGIRLADELNMEPSRLHAIKSGAERMTQKVATGLGYELRWVKIKSGGNNA